MAHSGWSSSYGLDWRSRCVAFVGDERCSEGALVLYCGHTPCEEGGTLQTPTEGGGGGGVSNLVRPPTAHRCPIRNGDLVGIHENHQTYSFSQEFAREWFTKEFLAKVNEQPTRNPPLCLAGPARIL